MCIRDSLETATRDCCPGPATPGWRGRGDLYAIRAGQREHRMDADSFRTRAADDAGPGVLLRRHGARQVGPEHDDDELRGDGRRRGHLDAVRILRGMSLIHISEPTRLG